MEYATLFCSPIDLLGSQITSLACKIYPEVHSRGIHFGVIGGVNLARAVILACYTGVLSGLNIIHIKGALNFRPSQSKLCKKFKSTLLSIGVCWGELGLVSLIPLYLWNSVAFSLY